MTSPEENTATAAVDGGETATENLTSTIDAARSKLQNLTVSSFRIWPPTQRTRDAVSGRLVETLTTPSVLSKRYGVLPADEAAEIARKIEEESFAAADGKEGGEVADEDGIETLQVYSREISKRMLEAVKARAGAAEGKAEAAAEEVKAEAVAETDKAPEESENAASEEISNSTAETEN